MVFFKKRGNRNYKNCLLKKKKKIKYFKADIGNKF